MSKRAGERLRKITFNIYEADARWMERHYGWGWTEMAREMIRVRISLLQRDEEDVDAERG